MEQGLRELGGRKGGFVCEHGAQKNGPKEVPATKSQSDCDRYGGDRPTVEVVVIQTDMREFH